MAAAPQQDPDARLASLPQQTVRPNSGPDYEIRGLVEWTGVNRRIDGNLTFHPDGGQLRIVDSRVEVVGDVLLTKNATLDVIDAELAIVNDAARAFRYWWQGGHLRTERAKIGGVKVNRTIYNAPFLLHDGLWDAKDTTVEYGGGIMLGWDRGGYLGRADQKGGLLRADGLVAGESSDYLHMSGWGDAILTNSHYAVSLYTYADASQSVTTRLDLGTTARLTDVYGDNRVHQGVTSHVANSPYRLELRNTTVPRWAVHAFEVTDRGRPYRLILDNADRVICNVHGIDLVGSPVLGGSWGDDPPGLPSTAKPGHHPIRPGQSVRVGNVTFEAGNRDVHVFGWGLYLKGAGTDYEIRGASQIAELAMTDGRLRLIGTRDYNAGCFANRVMLHGAADLTIQHGAVGEFASTGSMFGAIEAYGCSRCEIVDSRVSYTFLSTRRETIGNSCRGVDQATITLRRPVLWGELTFDQNSRAGSITVADAPTSQNNDLANLGFESWSGGSPSHWNTWRADATSSTRVRPGSGGQRSLQYTSVGSGGMVTKYLDVPRGAVVDAVGFVEVDRQAATSPLELVVEGRDSSGGSTGNATRAEARDVNGWQVLQAPSYVAGWNDAAVAPCFTDGSSGRTTARMDDLRVHVSAWWDNDNLYNLGFEAGYRSVGLAPDFSTAPDGWWIWAGNAAASSPRPGSRGRHSTNLVADAEQAFLVKDLTFTQPGDLITVTGWVRGDQGASSPKCWITPAIGEGQALAGMSKQMFQGGTGWQQFQIQHRVPARSATRRRWEFTRIQFQCYGGRGNSMKLDDLRVTIGR